MKNYWFRTEPGIGYGVTAESEEKARRLLAEYGYPRPGENILSVTEDIRMVDLDQNHVVPNCGPIVVRGVWYPCHNV